MDLSYADAGALALLINLVVEDDFMISRMVQPLVKVPAGRQLCGIASHGAFASVQTMT